MSGEWEYSIHHTISGDFLMRVDLRSNSMGRVLNEGRSGQSSMFPQVEWPRDQFHNMTTPWARMLVKSRNGVPVAAHVITGRRWNREGGYLELRHADVWSILAKRTTFGSNGYSGTEPTNSSLDLADQTVQSMPSWLVWAGTEGPTANFQLPIFLPEGKITLALITSIPHAGPDRRTYWDYEVTFVDDAIDELLKTNVGPDVDFQPRYNSSGGLELLMRVGALTGGVSDWGMSGASPDLFDVSHDEDATKRANVVYAIGNGSEALMKVRTASASPEIPALERAVMYKEIKDEGVLQSHANADLASFNRATDQVDASMLAGVRDDLGLGIEDLPLGHVFNLSYTDDPWEFDGPQAHRLIGFETSEGSTVRLSLQPTGGV